MSLLLIYSAKKIPSKENTSNFGEVTNMVIKSRDNSNDMMPKKSYKSPFSLQKNAADTHVIEVQLITGAHHFYHFQLHWSPWFCASGLEPWQENWGTLFGGSPFFLEMWRKIAGVDDSAWNLCRRIENYRRYSPYLNIFISWKHLLTIQDGTPVFEEERWRALAITKRCIIVLAQPSDTFNPGAEAAIAGYESNIYYLQLWYCNCLQLDCQSNSATNTSLPKRFRPVRLVELVGSIWPGRQSSSSTLGSEVKKTVWN